MLPLVNLIEKITPTANNGTRFRVHPSDFFLVSFRTPFAVRD